MTHPEDIQVIRDELNAFFEKHFEVLNEGNAAGTIEEALVDLDEQIKSAEETLAEESCSGRMSDVEFDYKAATGQIRSI